MSKNKTTVWILLGGFDYEGERVIAVLDSEKEAEALKEWGEKNKTGSTDYKRLRWGYDSLSIQKWSVGERSDELADAPARL